MSHLQVNWFPKCAFASLFILRASTVSNDANSAAVIETRKVWSISTRPLALGAYTRGVEKITGYTDVVRRLEVFRKPSSKVVLCFHLLMFLFIIISRKNDQDAGCALYRCSLHLVDVAFTVLGHSGTQLNVARTPPADCGTFRVPVILVELNIGSAVLWRNEKCHVIWECFGLV